MPAGPGPRPGFVLPNHPSSPGLRLLAEVGGGQWWGPPPERDSLTNPRRPRSGSPLFITAQRRGRRGDGGCHCRQRLPKTSSDEAITLACDSVALADALTVRYCPHCKSPEILGAARSVFVGSAHASGDRHQSDILPVATFEQSGKLPDWQTIGSGRRASVRLLVKLPKKSTPAPGGPCSGEKPDPGLSCFAGGICGSGEHRYEDEWSLRSIGDAPGG